MKKLKKIIFLIGAAFLVILINPQIAHGESLCTCTERASEPYASYYVCQEVCGRWLESVMPPSVIFENEPRCPPNTSGGCDCSCRFTVTMGPDDVCSFDPPGYEGTFSCVETSLTEEIVVETGDRCTNQTDCISNPPGRGECATENNCYCDLKDTSPTFQTCKLKLEGGDTCAENYQCISRICRLTSGETKTCWRTGVPLPEGEVEPPPLSEEEVFPTYKLKSPIGEVTGPELIGRIIKTVLGVVGALALAMFVYGGFTWLTSGGSPDKIQKGKDILMWAVIGLIIIFTSYTLVDFVLTAFGL